MEFETGHLILRLLQLMRVNAVRVIAFMIIVTGGYVLIELYAPDPRVEWPFGIVSFVLQYWLVAGLLKDLACRSAHAGGIGSLFIVSLLSTLGVLVGMLLLIIPGIYLMVRWAMSGPIVLSEPATATEALRRSWESTEGRFWPIFVVLLITLVPTALGLAVLFVGPEQATLATSFAYNFCFNAGVVLSWHAAVAFYLVSTSQAKMQQVAPE